MGKNEHVLSAEKLQEMTGLKGGFGRWMARLIVKILGIDKVNAIQAKFADDNAPDFAKHVLEDIGVRYEIPERDLDRIPAEGGFITVSNHHFGSIDGLILCDTVLRKRPDYKLLTTFLLSLVPNLREGFLPVDNLSGKQDARSVNSIRAALKHIADGGAIGFFPTGEVATYQKGKARTAIGSRPVIEDKPWASNIIKLIKKSGLPVIPIYFDGTNSANFHALGKIHPRLRTARLIHEVFNKRGTVVQVRIGQPVSSAETEGMDLESFGQYLRNRTYALEAECRAYTPPKVAEAQQPVAPAEDAALIREEMERIRDRVLFTSGDFRCYLTPAADIPHAFREISRLREEIFRSVGEGTGQALDADCYDTYYKQLILWNIPNGEIAGAYRIGIGGEILARPEKESGFYTSTLFRFQEGILPYLPKTMELGRTIVAPRYQRDVVTLKLLLSGIMATAAKTQRVEYLIGPASMSNDFPPFYKSLITYFILKNHSKAGASLLVKPTHPFRTDFLRVNPDQLLAGCHSIDDLDRLISTLSEGRYRLPVLLRKYICFGARILEFNVDPDFSDSVDGFVLMWIHDMPDNSYNAMGRLLNPEELQALSLRLGRRR